MGANTLGDVVVDAYSPDVESTCKEVQKSVKGRSLSHDVDLIPLYSTWVYVQSVNVSAREKGEENYL